MRFSQTVTTVKAVLLGLILAPSLALSQQCHLAEMKVSGHIARAGNVSVDLGEATPPSDPSLLTVYEGPPRIRIGNGPACTASPDVSIVFGQLWLGLDKVYISTYSGGENLVFAVDAKDCHIAWTSPEFEGPPAAYRNGILRMGILRPNIHRIRLNKACLPSR